MDYLKRHAKISCVSQYRKTWHWINSLLFAPPLEDRKKKKRQQKEKSPAGGKTNLQRSKTFVNLLFKKDRKEKSNSKSQSHHNDKGEAASVTGHRFSCFPAACSASYIQSKI